MNLTLLQFIKLSSHINPRLGFGKEPHFGRQTWSLLLNRIEAVDDVLLFANSFWGGGRKEFAGGEQRSPRIASIGRMDWLNDRQFRFLREHTSDDGHLSVLYKISIANSLLSELIKLYPLGGKPGDEIRDDLGLKRDETDELRFFVATHTDTHAIVGFASNADPCYIFGAHDVLQTLLPDATALSG